MTASARLLRRSFLRFRSRHKRPPKVVGLNRPEEGNREGAGVRVAHSHRNPVEAAPARLAPPKEVVEKLDQEKRMLLTKTESMALERLVNTLASRVNTQLGLLRFDADGSTNCKLFRIKNLHPCSSPCNGKNNQRPCLNVENHTSA